MAAARAVRRAAVAFLLSAVALHAEPAASSPPPATPDSTPSPLEQLFALGLPDVRGLPMVTITGDNLQENMPRREGPFYPRGNDGPAKLLANTSAWLVGTDPDGSVRFITTEGAPWKLTARDSPEKTKPLFKPVDPREVAKCILEVLRNPGQSAGEVPNLAPGLVIFAAQLERAGLVAESAEMLAAALQAAKSQDGPNGNVATADDMAYEAVIWHLAGTQYQQGYLEFLAHRDWAKWGATLHGLARRFAGVWPPVNGMDAAATAIEQHAKQPNPPPVTGPEVTPELQQIAKEMVWLDGREAEALGKLTGSLWIFPNGSDSSRISPTPAPGAPFLFDRLRNLGLRAVPLLLALQSDRYLMVVNSGSVAYSSEYNIERQFDLVRSSRSGNSSNRESYSGLEDRPRTRGEFAQNVLDALMPTGRRSAGSASDWYAKVKGASVPELVQYYIGLSEDYRFDRGLMIASVNNTAVRALMEEYLLTNEPNSRRLYTAQTFLDLQRENGLEFADRYEAKWLKPEEILAASKLTTQQLQDNAQSNSSRGNSAARIAYNLRQMRTQYGSVNLRQLLRDRVQAGWPQDSEADARLERTRNAMPPDAVVKTYLEVSQSGQPMERMYVLTNATEWANNSFGPVANPNDPKEKRFSPPPLTQELISYWRRGLTSADSTYEGTISERTAILMETIYGGRRLDPGSKFHERYATIPPRTLATHLARAEGRLAGQAETTLPAWPGVGWDRNQMEALVSRFESNPPGDIDAALSTLTPTQWHMLSDGAQAHLALQKLLHSQTDRVLNVALSGSGNGTVNRLIQNAKGVQLTWDYVAKLAEAAGNEAAQGSEVIALVYGGSGLEGATIRWQQVSGASAKLPLWRNAVERNLRTVRAFASAEKGKTMDESPSAGVYAYLEAGRDMRSQVMFGAAKWNIGPAATVPAGNTTLRFALSPDGSEATANFQKEFTLLLQRDTANSWAQPWAITIIGKPAAAKSDN